MSYLQVQDDFADPDGTLLYRHQTPVGYTWSQLAHDFVLVGGRAYASFQDPVPCIYVQEVNQSDATVIATLQCGAADQYHAPGLVIRADGPHTYLWVQLRGDGPLSLWQQTGPALGTVTQLGDAVQLGSGFSWAADAQPHDVRVTTAGPNVDVVIDGVHAAGWTTTAQARGTRYGIRGFEFDSSADSFGAFEIDTPETLVIPAWPGAYQQSLFAPSFAAPDGTRLNTLGFTEPVGPWTTQGGLAEVLDTSGPLTGYVAVREASWADAALEVRVKIPLRPIVAGVTACYADLTTDGFLEGEFNTRDLYTPERGFGCWRWDPPRQQFTELVTRPAVYVPGETYTMRMRRRGPLVIMECPELGLQMAGTDPTLQYETRHGLFLSQDLVGPGPAAFDAFRIWRIPAVPGAPSGASAEVVAGPVGSAEVG